MKMITLARILTTILLTTLVVANRDLIPKNLDSTQSVGLFLFVMFLGFLSQAIVTVADLIIKDVKDRKKTE